jgi:hypothetical protein
MYVALTGMHGVGKTTVFSFVGDDLRPASIEFQRKVDACLWRAFGMFETPVKKIHRLQATEVDARVEEILALLPAS